MEMRRQRLYLVLLICGVVFLLYRGVGSRGERGRRAPSWVGLGGVDPANATLGFGAVVAVSREGSPRRESLLLAANVTEIDITIPPQPKWSDEDVQRLRADKDSRISRGSALAWLGHLNTLRWFLASPLETMLVLEDDVDWDIHLRTFQIPTAAKAIRQLVADKTDPPGKLTNVPTLNNFWGDSSTWDILYLGHCGDIFRPDTWTTQIPRVVYEDRSLPPARDMHPYTTKFLEKIGIPEYHRVIHKSIFPLCTFGFALTRGAAYRLLNEIAPKEAEGGTMAYDVRVLEACRDLGFRCWSANPELFHHMVGESEIASVDAPQGGPMPGAPPPQEGGGGKVGADDSGRLKPLRLGKAPNINCGARSSQFFTQDSKTLQFLQQKVGREGVCLQDPDEDSSAGRGWVTGDKYDGPGDPRMYI